MLFYLFFSLLYICILLSILLPIGKLKSVANGRQTEKQGQKMSIFCVFVYGYILLRSSVILTIIPFQHFSWAKSLFSLQPLTIFLLPRCCCGCSLRITHSICVRFVCHTTVSINHHKPHAFELVVIVVGGVAVCCYYALLCRALPCHVYRCVCIYGNKFTVALGYVFNL